MTHKLVWRLMALVTLCVIIAAIGFSLVVSYTPRLSGVTLTPDEPIRALAPKVLPVPHPVDVPRFVNCEACHALDARIPVPTSHRSFDNRTCELCHAFPRAAEEPVATESHSFGWRTPLGELTQEAFGLADPCVATTTLEQILTGTTCSVRPDGLMCVDCHWAGLAEAGVRLDDLEDRQDLIDRGYIERFVSGQSAKPPNLKRLFADWQSRGYPD